MRFLVLMAEDDHFARWEELDDDTAREEVFAAFAAFAEAVGERGSVLAGEGLARPELARTLRRGRGPERAVTEGPYAETVEQLGGFWLVELPDLATALDLARLLPEAYDVEVRPVVDG